MAHILPHWNWPDRIGQVVPVHVYTSGTEAELFVNGKSWGRWSKREGQDFRLVWDSVVYQPGSVRVVAYKNGQKWAEDEVQTTGEAQKIRLEADRNSLDAGSRELAFVTVRLTDEEGRTVPTACCPLKFEVEGAGELVATDNGDPISFTPFQSAEREAFNGLALAIVRARKGAAGEIRVRVSGEGLEPAVLQLEAR